MTALCEYQREKKLRLIQSAVNTDGYRPLKLVASCRVYLRLAGRIAINYKRDEGYWQNSNGPDMAQTDYLNGRETMNFVVNDQFAAVLKLTMATASTNGSCSTLVAVRHSTRRLRRIRRRGARFLFGPNTFRLCEVLLIFLTFST